MRTLLDLDKAQFHRLNAAIAALERLSPAERQRKAHLRQALESEKQELIRCNPAIRLAARLKAAA